MALGRPRVAYYYYILHPELPRQMAAKKGRSTPSSTTSGTSTSCTTSSSCARRSGSAASFWKIGDGRIIDGLGPDGIAARVRDVAAAPANFQTGYVYHYAFAMLVGVAGARHLVPVRGEA